MEREGRPCSPECPYNSMSAFIVVTQTFPSVSAQETFKSLLTNVEEGRWKLLIMVCVKDCCLNSSSERTSEMIPFVLCVKTKVQFSELC